MMLTGVSETLLVPLCARWLETQRPDAIIKDAKAGELVERIGCDCQKYRYDLGQVGTAVRTEILDHQVRAFMRRQPPAVVVNLGAGLCTRFYRIDDGEVDWVEIDLPQVTALWPQLFDHDDRPERHHRLTRSVLDRSWMDDVERIARGRPVLFIAEGLFMYFRERELRALVKDLSERFPSSELLVEAMTPMLAMTTLWNPAVARTSAQFKWGTLSTRSIARWAPGIKYLREWDYFDFYPERWGVMRLLRAVPFCGQHISMMIGHLRFTGAPA